MHRLMAKLAGRGVRIILLAAISLLISAMGGVLSATAGDDVSTSATEQANRLAREGHTDAAVRVLQATLAAHPEDPEARLALANIYAATGESAKAEQEFREALRLHPGSSSAELALGAFYVDAGSMDSAEQVLQETVHKHPDLAAAHAQLALVLAMERKYAKAQVQIQLVPPPGELNARVRYFRLVASISSGLGDTHAASHAMEEALRALPRNEELQFLAAVTEAEAGDWQACLRNVAPLYAKQPAPNSGLLLLRAQLASHVDFLPTLQSIRALDLTDSQRLELATRAGELLAAADKDKEAAQEFQEALKIVGGHDDTLLYNLAVEQYRLRLFDDAFGTLKLLREEKDSADIEDLAGDIQEQKGDLLAAVQSHENAIAMSPREERYRLSLGAELLLYRNYQAAVVAFQHAAELFPDSARVYVGLGMSYYFIENYDESVSAFLNAAKLDPEPTRALEYLSATQVDNPAGPSPEAVHAVCSRADSDPTESATVTWCGALLLRRAYLAGDRSASAGVIRRLRVATELAPGNPIASCSLGQALEWTEQLQEARHWLEICVRQRPDSAEDHYRLSHIYQRLGLTQAAAEQAELTNQANSRQDPDQTIAKKFLNETLGRSATDSRTK
jgi:predicted Zn-dependent protease